MHTFLKNNKTIEVGWNISLNTFFGKMYLNNNLVIFVGKTKGEIQTVLDLQNQIEIRIPQDIKNKLESDKNSSQSPSTIIDNLLDLL